MLLKNLKYLLFDVHIKMAITKHDLRSRSRETIHNQFFSKGHLSFSSNGVSKNCNYAKKVNIREVAKDGQFMLMENLFKRF